MCLIPYIQYYHHLQKRFRWIAPSDCQEGQAHERRFFEINFSFTGKVVLLKIADAMLFDTGCIN